MQSPHALGYEESSRACSYARMAFERYQKANPHPHFGTNARVNAKIQKSKTLVHFEGSTQAMCVPAGRRARLNTPYGEAKFLSDISGSVSYWPVRNQIARNVEAELTDCMHALYPEKNKAELVIEPDAIDNFWFLLAPARAFPRCRAGESFVRI